VFGVSAPGRGRLLLGFDLFGHFQHLVDLQPILAGEAPAGGIGILLPADGAPQPTRRPSMGVRLLGGTTEEPLAVGGMEAGSATPHLLGQVGRLCLERLGLLDGYRTHHHCLGRVDGRPSFVRRLG
jgi:hypothetical protein